MSHSRILVVLCVAGQALCSMGVQHVWSRWWCRACGSWLVPFKYRAGRPNNAAGECAARISCSNLRVCVLVCPQVLSAWGVHMCSSSSAPVSSLPVARLFASCGIALSRLLHFAVHVCFRAPHGHHACIATLHLPTASPLANAGCCSCPGAMGAGCYQVVVKVVCGQRVVSHVTGRFVESYWGTHAGLL